MPSRCNFLRLFSSSMFNTYLFFSQQDMSIIGFVSTKMPFFFFFLAFVFFGSRCKYLGDTVDGSEIPNNQTTWFFTKKNRRKSWDIRLPTSTGDAGIPSNNVSNCLLEKSGMQDGSSAPWHFGNGRWFLNFPKSRWFHSGIHLGHPYKSL